MRMLGVDFGKKRIGLAVGESEFGSASRRPPLKASGSLEQDAKNLAEIAKTEGATAMVLGLPVNEQGSDRAEKICRRLAAQIRELGWSVYEVDESLTTVEGEANLLAVYRKGAVRERLDGEAAALILERFFNAQE